MSLKRKDADFEKKALNVWNRKLFVGGLAWYTTSSSLHDHFAQYGEIEEAVVIYDKETTRSKGFGFVTFVDEDSAQLASQNPNPIIDGRKANCNLAILGVNKSCKQQGKKENLPTTSNEMPGIQPKEEQDIIDSSDPLFQWHSESMPKPPCCQPVPQSSAFTTDSTVNK